MIACVAAVVVGLALRSGAAERAGGEAQTLAAGLEAPWGLLFLPTGDALVGERRTGRIYAVPAHGGALQHVATVPGVVADGDGGLLGLAVDPLFLRDAFIYAYLTTTVDNRIVRFRLAPDPTTVSEQQVIVSGIGKNTFHNGGALELGPDGMLYAGTGDAGRPSTAQDPGSLNGKILRMDILGGSPNDNPTPGSLVYSLGHRDVRGLTWDDDARLWATDIGAGAANEVNVVKGGHNYGWPLVKRVGDTRTGHFTGPAVTWVPAGGAGPSGAAVVGDTLYVGASGGQRLWARPLTGASAGKPRVVFEDRYGRLRSFTAAPDGSLWITIGNRDARGGPGHGEDRVLRFDPDRGVGGGGDDVMAAPEGVAELLTDRR